MKKNLIAAVSAVLAISLLAGCGANNESNSGSESMEQSANPAVETVEQTASYTLYNTTGETVTELYLYEAGSEEKGENLAGEGLAADATLEVTRTAASEEEAKEKTYVLEFVTESGAAQKFETLHFEVAPISLLSVDAAAGATAVKFEAPEMTAIYNVVNTTGETVTELYLYEAGSEEKGENLAGEGLAADAAVELTRTAAGDKVEEITYVLEFVTEGGAAQKFETLNFEQAKVELLSVDAAAGATPVVFGALEK